MKPHSSFGTKQVQFPFYMYSSYTVLILKSPILSCRHTLHTRYPSLVHLFPCVGDTHYVWYTSEITRSPSQIMVCGILTQLKQTRRELMISTGRETHELRTKRMSSAQPDGTFSVGSSFQGLCIAGLIDLRLTSNAFHRMSPHHKHTSNVWELIQTD